MASDSNTSNDSSAQISETIQRLSKIKSSLETELSKVIVGQNEVIEQILICLFAQGHCLLEGAWTGKDALDQHLGKDAGS